MELKDLMKLVDAGFSKDEIMKLAAAGTQKEEQKEKPAKEEQKAEEIKEEQKSEEQKSEEQKASEDPNAGIAEAIKEAMKPFQSMYEKMALMAGKPSFENIQPKGIDDVIDDFFKGE